MLKTEHLPRQAWDKHREKLKQKKMLLQARGRAWRSARSAGFLVRKRSFARHFVLKIESFTKPGSGQTRKELGKTDTFLQSTRA